MSGERLVLVFILLFGLAITITLVSALFKTEYEVVTPEFIDVGEYRVSITLFLLAMLSTLGLSWLTGFTWKKAMINLLYSFTLSLLFVSFTTIISDMLNVPATQISSIELAVSVIAGFVVGLSLITVLTYLGFCKKGQISMAITTGMVIALAIFFFAIIIFIWIAGILRVLALGLIFIVLLYIGAKLGIPEKMLYLVIGMIFVIMVFSAIKTGFFKIIP